MRGSRQRRAAWLLLVLTLAGLVAAAGWQVVREDPARALDPAPGDVVVVGVPGLTWDLIGTGTPELLDLAAGGSGTLVVRGVDRVTCPAQGWLTLGAGQRAGSGLAGHCTRPEVGPDGTPVSWASWRAAAAGQSLPAELGTLATTVRSGGGCVAAYGPLAALAATDADGEVAAYRPGGLHQLAADADPADPVLDADCRLHLVDAPAVIENDRSQTLTATDAALGELRSTLPRDATLVVAGLADTNARAELHAVIVSPPAAGTTGDPALLTSPSTRQPGLVQTTDLTATLLSLLELPVPDAVAGSPIRLIPGEPTHNRDLSDAGTQSTRLLPWTLGLLALLVVPPLLLLLLLRHRRRAGAGPAVLGTVAMALPAASFLAGLLPWWRAGQPWFGLLGATFAAMLLLLTIAWGGPWRCDPRGPAAVVAALTVLVIGTDVILGGPLGLIAFLGVQPIEAGRFYGMGNVAFGAISAAALVLAGCLASWLGGRSRQAVAAVLAVGLTVAAVDGAPAWGADFGGVPALLVATGVLALPVAGGRLSAARLALLVAAAVVVGGIVMVLDWLRPEESRSHLGEFVQAVLDGAALQIVTRKLDQSLGILLAYLASWLAVLVLALVVVAVARPESALGRPLRPLWTLPHLRPTAWALIACWVLGWVLNDSGIALVAMGLTVALGAGLSIVVRAHPDRVRIPEPPPA